MLRLSAVEAVGCVKPIQEKESRPCGQLSPFLCLSLYPPSLPTGYSLGGREGERAGAAPVSAPLKQKSARIRRLIHPRVMG